jgi:hypothetical protein
MVAGTIRVRMYAVGFGDCFLLGFPGPDRERLVLIDCGVHSATKRGRGAHLGKAVIPDILRQAKAANGASGKPRIDVVVATHHHLDHVSGFRYVGWDKVEVGEVWLPWTEDPDDAVAQRIRAIQSRQSAFLLSLDQARSRDWSTIRAISENNAGFTNAAAMTTLQEGFAGNPRRYFLPETTGQERERRFRPAVLPGVEVVILGPSRDESTIRDMNPPDKESYLRLGAGRQLVEGGDPLPFASFFKTPAEFKAEKAYERLVPTDSELGRVEDAGKTDALAIAVALEQATNGTSLMLLFRMGDTTMLFPGDAQWGTWDRVLNDPEGKELLKSVNLYKVGHHGSHNATPVSFVRKHLRNADASMVPVGPTRIPSWGDIPRRPLINRLRKRSAIILDSDELREDARAGKPAPDNPAVTRATDGLWTEIRLPLNRDGG